MALRAAAVDRPASARHDVDGPDRHPLADRPPTAGGHHPRPAGDRPGRHRARRAVRVPVGVEPAHGSRRPGGDPGELRHRAAGARTALGAVVAGAEPAGRGHRGRRRAGPGHAGRQGLRAGGTRAPAGRRGGAQDLRRSGQPSAAGGPLRPDPARDAGGPQRCAAVHRRPPDQQRRAHRRRDAGLLRAGCGLHRLRQQLRRDPERLDLRRHGRRAHLRAGDRHRCHPPRLAHRADRADRPRRRTRVLRRDAGARRRRGRLRRGPLGRRRSAHRPRRTTRLRQVGPGRPRTGGDTADRRHDHARRDRSRRCLAPHGARLGPGRPGGAVPVRAHRP